MLGSRSKYLVQYSAWLKILPGSKYANFKMSCQREVKFQITPGSINTIGEAEVNYRPYFSKIYLKQWLYFNNSWL